ncbi:MAG: hypothetical protein ACLQBL_28750 [Polyangiaceae bacterium]
MNKTRTFGLLVALTGCASLPAVTFISGDGGTPAPDATVAEVDSAGGGNDAGEDSPVDTDPTEDGGDAAATIECGAALVTTCAQCAGSPLRCKKGARDQCVADCTECEANWFPCIHCTTPDAGVYGNCLAVGAKGQVACTTTNLCACNTPADCPVIAGGAETCDVVKGAPRCLTCGSPSTANASCLPAGGSAGTCQLADGSVPKCE